MDACNFLTLLGCLMIGACALPFSDSTDQPEVEDAFESTTPNCSLFYQLDIEDVNILPRGKLFVKAYNITISSEVLPFVEPTLDICFNRSESLSRTIFLRCPKFSYEEGEFTDLGDGRVDLYGGILEPGSFEIEGGTLSTCADYEDSGTNVTDPKSTLYIRIGQGCSVVSIFALLAHLVAFCLVPSLRNLPGYNLAALTLAFLFGYLFSLIGQIPQVLGTECKISGILQQYFFLVAFFYMNALSFDVWRTLKMCTTQLVVSSHSAKKKQFICYSVYSWGVPFLISTATVTADNVAGVPLWIKPGFANKDICWIDSWAAKVMFFSGPSFTLFLINAVFFVMSAFTIKSNTMKKTSVDDQKSARTNFLLYLRLAMMMGVTWLTGLVAAVVGDRDLWMVADVLTSLQGLFVFLMFTCTRKVYKALRKRLDCKGMLLGGVRSPKTSTTDVLPTKKISFDTTALSSRS